MSTLVPARDETLRLWEMAHERFGTGLRRCLHMAESGPETEPQSVDERLLQCTWHDQLLRLDALATASGKRVEVIEPGRWNTGRGPDFLDARLRIAGHEVNGDIELHVQSAGWTQHNHHRDFEYNRVVLHVCLHASDDRPYEEKQNGERLERLVLDGVLEPDLETLQRTLSVDDYPYARPESLGRCHEFLADQDPNAVREFLLVAGRARIEDKVARFEAQSNTASVDQVVYQALMTAQGFKANKTLYFLLSKRAPFEEIMDMARDEREGDRPAFLLAVLMHVAQLFPTQPDLFDAMDDESRAYAQRLGSFWGRARPYFADRLMPPTRRWYAGMRPPSFPPRRLSAVAFLLCRMADPAMPLMRALRDRIVGVDVTTLAPRESRQFINALVELLIVEEPNHYFATRFTLGGKPGKPLALMGEPAARSLLFNAILPLLLVEARRAGDAALEQRVWAVLHRFPPLAGNSVTDFMRRRLFGTDEQDKAWFQSELTCQALIKIFHSCCAWNERTCDSCTFLNPPFRPAG